MDLSALRVTYRVQLHAGFRLTDAQTLVPYLDRLGVSHLYASPVLAAKPGSLHGYDVVDPTRLNPELGTEEEWRALASELHRRDMGILLDIVPNHMGTGPNNPFWEDVLANGRRSNWARWFDVDWDSERSSLRGRILVPVLADTLESVLDRGEMSLVREEGRIRLKYSDYTFPIAPETESALRDVDVARWHEGERGRARMRDLMDAQRYRLAFWKRASVAINYRRFFDVNELIAIRVHDPAVFRETHALILQWVEDRVIDGLRIDHIDGLRDPQGYLDALRVEVAQRRPAGGEPFPIVVEKILSTGERLRESWPVQGTTGYEFLNDLEAIFIDPEGVARLDDGYRRTVGPRAREGFEGAAVRGKELVLRAALAADVSHLARLLRRALRARRARESPGMTTVIRRFIATLPVYRTYLDGRGPVHPDDRDVIDRALAGARERWGRRAELDRLGAVLTSTGDEHRMRFVQRLQQTSGPATAKGVEDTALYRYVPLASRNEVGGDPGRDVAPAVGDLHRANKERQARWPRSLVCTSTHDTKRSADVRARIDVLTEISEEWLGSVRGWRRLLAGLRVRIPGGTAPDAATEWLMFQTLLGIWPAEVLPDRAAHDVRERVVEYMRKANREAKVRTSWTTPNERYEHAVDSFIGGALGNEAFVRELAAWASRVAPAGYCNALSRLLVHLTAPGTPDIYQGDEMWNFSLVDPDNRRPVDFAARESALDVLDALVSEHGAATACAELLTNVADGRIKLHVARTALRERRLRPELFARGTYTPLEGQGERRRHVFGFARTWAGAGTVTAVTKLPFTMSKSAGIPTGLAWGHSTITFPTGDVPHRWRCALTGLSLEAQSVNGGAALLAREVFRTLPVALLIAE